jgi:molybdate transport system ATP-binding protein
MRAARSTSLARAAGVSSPFFTVDVTIERPSLTIHASLAADAGETVALLGPNGAGKSSVVEAIAGVLEPSQATIQVTGERIDGLPPERRPIGVAFQGARLFPTMSVLENVAFPLRARGVPRRDARAAARRLLDDVVGKAVAPDAATSNLSGGEAQRVALARALAPEPRVLLLDEPLAAVDVSARADLRALLRRITSTFSGVCVLVAHDPIDALTLADRIVVLERGEVSQSGTPAELRAAPATSYVADLVGVNLLVGTLEPIDGGTMALRTSGGGTVIVAATGTPAATADAASDVMATISPSDVALHLRRPEGSPRNVFRGAVEEVAIVGDRARVRLATEPPLVAEITRGSAERLGLEPGLEIFASCKAVEVRLVEPAPVP